MFYTWGWRASILGALITIVALVFVFFGTRIRDQDFARQMASLNLDASSTRERAADLELKAAEAQQEVERLKAQAAWRRLSADQRAKLIASLRPLGWAIRVRFIVSDPEASLFASELIQAMSDAGVQVEVGRQIITPVPLGVIVGTTTDMKSDLLIAILRNAGIQAERGEPSPGLDVLVGSKPSLF